MTCEQDHETLKLSQPRGINSVFYYLENCSNMSLCAIYRNSSENVGCLSEQSNFSLKKPVVRFRRITGNYQILGTFDTANRD